VSIGQLKAKIDSLEAFIGDLENQITELDVEKQRLSDLWLETDRQKSERIKLHEQRTEVQRQEAQQRSKVKQMDLGL